ncbi:hypothetical protein ACJX0J_029802, partial [Zea mays]
MSIPGCYPHVFFFLSPKFTILAHSLGIAFYLQNPNRFGGFLFIVFDSFFINIYVWHTVLLEKKCSLSSRSSDYEHRQHVTDISGLTKNEKNGVHKYQENIHGFFGGT